MRKSNLPLVRKKMRSFGNIAIRGTNQVHEKNTSSKKTYNGFHNHFIFSKDLFNSKIPTRDLVSRIGNAVNDAMHYAFRYSGFEYKLVGNKFKYKYNPKDKPTIVFVMSKEGFGSDENLNNITLAHSFLVSGSNNKLGLPNKGAIIADKKNVFSVTIDKKDLIDLNSALNKHFKKLEADNKKILGRNMSAEVFLTNFLVRRVISKALVKYRKIEN